jgi:hypothetical protein
LGAHAQPLLQFDEFHRTALIEANQRENASRSSNSSRYPFTFRKAAVTSDRETLVSIYERMILRQALPERGRFLNNVLVLAALWPRQSGSKGAEIPNAKGTSELRDQLVWTAITSSTVG